MNDRHHPKRCGRLEREIMQMRDLAFSVPDDTPFEASAYLEIEKSAIVRARVLLDCALIEEMTSLIIMNHVLCDSSKWNQIKYFGRIKRYSVLYHDVLGRLTARNKIAVVKKFSRVPRAISSATERIFALRDILSHVYTFDYDNKRTLLYKGHNIFTVSGFQSYIDDSNKVVTYFIEQAKIL